MALERRNYKSDFADFLLCYVPGDSTESDVGCKIQLVFSGAKAEFLSSKDLWISFFSPIPENETAIVLAHHDKPVFKGGRFVSESELVLTSCYRGGFISPVVFELIGGGL